MNILNKILYSVLIVLLLASTAWAATLGYALMDTESTLMATEFPLGETQYFSTTGTAVTIASQSDGSTNMVAITPVTSLNGDSYLFTNSNGRLTYTGLLTKSFHVAATLSIAPVNPAETFVVGLSKNGGAPTGKIIQKVTTASDTQAFSFHSMVTLATNDYIEVYIGNLTSSADVTVNSLNSFAMGM